MTGIQGNTRRPDITCHPDGTIQITSRVTKMLGLKVGDVIDIGIEGIECYLYIKYRAENVIGVHSSRCCSTGKNSHHFRVYSVVLTDAMYKMCEADKSEPLRLYCGGLAENNYVGKCVYIITHRR